MSNIISKFLNLIPHSGNVFLSGALVLGLFQYPLTQSVPQEASLEAALKGSLETIAESLSTPHAEAAEISLGHVFFGKKALAATEDKIIEQKMDFVSTRKAFPASLAVIQKHEKTIKSAASKYGVPADVAIGVGLLENGGSETAKSPAGALGVFQLMPATARSLGLTVTKSVDERKDPKKNIDAGMRYLRSNYDRFGDWGLATWAYHAGEGNVSKALKIYAKEQHGIALAGLKDQAKMREYVEKHDVNVNKLLSSKGVKVMTKKLNDDSAGYPYKVIATAKLFKKAKSQTSVVGGEIVRKK